MNNDGEREPNVKRLLDDNAKLLLAKVREDRFLTEVGTKLPSHSFLKHSTQAVYLRQVDFLSAPLVARTRKLPEDIKVLDWGCGKGHITHLLRERGFNVTSCDVRSTEGDSAFGQETPILQQLAIRVIPLEDPVQLPFENATFDAVVSFGVLEHVKSDSLSMREVRRVLKTAGLFFIAFLPYRLSWTQAVARAHGDKYHDRLYTHGRVRQLAADSGFRLVSMRHAQLFPKNSVPLEFDRWLEPLDRLLCAYTPCKYLATNLELALVAEG
jgi:SAM-dependent methyltransferase